MIHQKRLFVAPSILAADLGAMRDEIRGVESAGADWLHIDVMDGSFVPPITFGDNLVSIARGCSGLFLDVHLMITEPERHLEAFQKAGAQRIIVHQEACPHLFRTLERIGELGMKAGVAINPGTPTASIFDVLSVCDLALVMTVNPGWGGQPFISHCLPKIRELRNEISKQKLPVHIEVDGGINSETARKCVAEGADVLVAGSFIFRAADRTQAIKDLRE